MCSMRSVRGMKAWTWTCCPGDGKREKRTVLGKKAPCWTAFRVGSSRDKKTSPKKQSFCTGRFQKKTHNLWAKKNRKQQKKAKKYGCKKKNLVSQFHHISIAKIAKCECQNRRKRGEGQGTQQKEPFFSKTENVWWKCRWIWIDPMAGVHTNPKYPPGKRLFQPPALKLPGTTSSHRAEPSTFKLMARVCVNFVFLCLGNVGQFNPMEFFLQTC